MHIWLAMNCGEYLFCFCYCFCKSTCTKNVETIYRLTDDQVNAVVVGVEADAKVKRGKASAATATALTTVSSSSSSAVSLKRPATDSTTKTSSSNNNNNDDDNDDDNNRTKTTSGSGVATSDAKKPKLATKLGSNNSFIFIIFITLFRSTSCGICRIFVRRNDDCIDFRYSSNNNCNARDFVISLISYFWVKKG